MYMHIGRIIDFRNSVSVLLQTATLSFMLETELYSLAIFFMLVQSVSNILAHLYPVNHALKLQKNKLSNFSTALL